MLKAVSLAAVLGCAIGFAHASPPAPPVIFQVTLTENQNGGPIQSFMWLDDKMSHKKPLKKSWIFSAPIDGFSGSATQSVLAAITANDGIAVATTNHFVSYAHGSGGPWVILSGGASYKVIPYIKGPQGTPYQTEITSTFTATATSTVIAPNAQGIISLGWGEVGGLQAGYLYSYGGPGTHTYTETAITGAESVIYKGEIYTLGAGVRPIGDSSMFYGITAVGQPSFFESGNGTSITKMVVTNLNEPASYLRIQSVNDNDPDNPVIKLMPLQGMDRIDWSFNGQSGSVPGLFKPKSNVLVTIPNVQNAPVAVNTVVFNGYRSGVLVATNSATIDQTAETFTSTADPFTATAPRGVAQACTWQTTVHLHRRDWDIAGDKANIKLDSVDYALKTDAPFTGPTYNPSVFGLVSQATGTPSGLLTGSNQNDAGLLSWNGTWIPVGDVFLQRGVSEFKMSLKLAQDGKFWRFAPTNGQVGQQRFVIN